MRPVGDVGFGKDRGDEGSPTLEAKRKLVHQNLGSNVHHLQTGFGDRGKG